MESGTDTSGKWSVKEIRNERSDVITDGIPNQ